MSPFPPAALCVNDLAVTRGGRRVFEGIDFHLATGEAIVLSGPNGVGKSTLLRALLGLVRSDHGTVAIVSCDGVREPPQAHCHYVGHRDAVKPALSVRENLAFWQVYLGGGGIDVDAALDEMGLADLARLPAGYLSAGQRRRLGLARLLTARRTFWLLDEPTAALDVASERRLIDLIRRHLDRNGAVIAATHLAMDLPGARHLSLSTPAEAEADNGEAAK